MLLSGPSVLKVSLVSVCLEKSDGIQDGFIHYQLLRFCQTTLLQYLNSHILIGNRCVLQHHHVDCKILDSLLKKSTKQHSDGWDASSQTSDHMVLHFPHPEGGFGVTFNDVTKDVSFYTYYFTFCTLTSFFLSGTSDRVVVQGRPQGPIHMVITPSCPPSRHSRRSSSQI